MGTFALSLCYEHGELSPYTLSQCMRAQVEWNSEPVVTQIPRFKPPRYCNNLL